MGSNALSKLYCVFHKKILKSLNDPNNNTTELLMSRVNGYAHNYESIECKDKCLNDCLIFINNLYIMIQLHILLLGVQG